MQKHYVAGFMFGPEDRVALIQKIRPAWQAGKLNAIGGTIERGESPYAAMVREFREETGVDHREWKRFCQLKGSGWEVFFYLARVDALKVQTMTDESVYVVDPYRLGADRVDILPNLRWLIPMALSMPQEQANSFIVEENDVQRREVSDAG